jgi:hypothetical protein
MPNFLSFAWDRNDRGRVPTTAHDKPRKRACAVHRGGSGRFILDRGVTARQPFTFGRPAGVGSRGRIQPRPVQALEPPAPAAKLKVELCGI